MFEAVKDDAVALSIDPFGNYLVQKLLQYGTLEQRVELATLTANSLVGIALNVHGTRVVQKMVEVAETEPQATAICEAIAPNIMQLILDMNGNHVVQVCRDRGLLMISVNCT